MSYFSALIRRLIYLFTQTMRLSSDVPLNEILPTITHDSSQHDDYMPLNHGRKGPGWALVRLLVVLILVSNSAWVYMYTREPSTPFVFPLGSPVR